MKVSKKAGMLLTLLMMMSMLFVGGVAANAAGARMLASVKADAKKAKVTWKKVSDADRYAVYCTECGKKFSKTNRTITAKKSFILKKLSKKKTYKVKVVAQKKRNGKYAQVGDSYILHFVTADNKRYTNPKSVSVRQKSVALEAGGTKVLRTAVKKAVNKKALLEEDHSPKLRFFSSDRSVAKVSSAGKITVKKAGKCTVYAVAVNGMYDSVEVVVESAAEQEIPGREVPQEEDPSENLVGREVPKIEDPSENLY